MTSREQLWEQFGQGWGWPSEDLTLEQDLIDLAWHQKEAQRRSSFTYQRGLRRWVSGLGRLALLAP